MTRILGIELRRSNALTLALLLVVASAVLVVLNGTSWVPNWLLLGYIHGSDVLLLLPLSLAGGAVLGRREKRTRADELLTSTGRPKMQRLLTGLLALGAAVTAAHLLVFAVGALVVAINGSYLNAATLLWPLSGVIMLIGGTWLGMAAGRAWSSPLVPPLVAVLALAAQVGLSEAGGPGGTSPLRNLSALGQPPSYDWEATSARVLAGYALVGLGLAGAGFLLATGRSWLPRVGAVAVLALALPLAAVVPGTEQADHYRVDTAAQKLVCAGGTPQVCVTAVHAYVLDDAVPQVRRGLELLAKLPGAPQRAVEWRADKVFEPGQVDWDHGTTRPEPGTMAFDLALDDGNRLGTSLTQNIVLAAGAQYSGCQDLGSDVIATHAAGAWLMGTDVLTGVEDAMESYPEMQQRERETVAALRALPEKEQIRRVTAMRDAALNCQKDLLAILTGVPS